MVLDRDRNPSSEPPPRGKDTSPQQGPRRKSHQAWYRKLPQDPPEDGTTRTMTGELDKVRQMLGRRDEIAALREAVRKRKSSAKLGAPTARRSVIVNDEFMTLLDRMIQAQEKGLQSDPRTARHVEGIKAKHEQDRLQKEEEAERIRREDIARLSDLWKIE